MCWNFHWKPGSKAHPKLVLMNQLGMAGGGSEATIEASRYQALIAAFQNVSTTFTLCTLMSRTRFHMWLLEVLLEVL